MKQKNCFYYTIAKPKVKKILPNFSFKKKSLTCLPLAQAGQKKH
jgi:hypothetical protein